MSYYKITYESNTIEGLKAIQGSFLGNGASAIDSTASETTAPPPRQQDVENTDSFSGVVQTPPNAGEAGASLDNTAFYPPPPSGADSAIMDIGLEGEFPPPPNDQEGNEAQPGEKFRPLKQSASKSPKTAKKNSK